jgi:hypothetical protein
VQALQQVMARLFMEQQLKRIAEDNARRARWDFARHHRRNPSHAAWKKRRASGRH